MKNLTFTLTVVFLLISSISFSQNNSVVLDGGYIVLDGGTATNNIYIVIDQPNPLGIIRSPSGGYIHSENQYNFVKWVTGTSTGNYVFPFGVATNPTDTIPFIFNKTAGNSSVSVSTWATSIPNNPRPLATNVGAVTSMPGITDSVVYAIDRFWDIQATATTADLTFSYRGIENTTLNPTNLVKTQHWNGSSWDTPVGIGTAGVTTGIGTAGPFVGQNTFSPWVLVTTCITDTLTQNLNICQGDSIIVGVNTYTTTGTFIDTLTNMQGCDSIITTNLTVNPTVIGTDVQTACNTFTWIDGITYTVSTTTPTFTIVGGAASGCDSVVTLNLTINNTATGTDVQTACNSFTWIDGVTYTSSTNTPTDTMVGGAVGGCDSIVTLNLTINNTTTSTDVQTACNTFTWIDGITYTTSNNTATFTIVGGAASGCDSIVTLNLTINNTATGTDVQTTCNTFTWIDGVTYTTSTNTPTFTIVGGASSGCDSVVTLNLTISNSTKTTNVLNKCQGFSVTVGTNTYTTTGIYTDIVNNCDTIITDLTINPIPTFTLIKADDNCGQSIGSITTNIISATPPIIYSWNTGSTNAAINNLPVGVYTINVTDSTGCSSSDAVTINDFNLNCDYFVYVPNVFSPNNDGNNDVFFIEGKGVQTLNVKIYNRWGNKVFEINNIKDGWDGKYKGSEQNTAVFVYVLQATFENGKTVTQSGNVSIVK